MSKKPRLDDLQNMKAMLQSLYELCNRMIIQEEKENKTPSTRKANELKDRTKVISNLRTNLYKNKKVA